MDPRLARLFDQYRSSELLRSERALAEDADAPDRVDVAALAQGRIREPWQRRALARQLIAGTNAIERALPALAVPDDEIEGPPTPALRGFIVLVAAATILFAAFTLTGIMGGAGLGSRVRITQGSGQEMRSRSDPGSHRVNVTSTRPAYAALARIVDGKLIVEHVEGDRLTLLLNADEETLLPLDREITTHGAERWLVLLSAEPFEGTLAEWFARAARGDVPSGCELRDFVVRSAQSPPSTEPTDSTDSN